jgi:hypothetical protein
MFGVSRRRVNMRRVEGVRDEKAREGEGLCEV